jgi:hypothetical protein
MATTAFEFFTKYENMLEHGKMFLEILKLDEAHVLRERYSRETESLIGKILGEKIETK